MLSIYQKKIFDVRCKAKNSILNKNSLSALPVGERSLSDDVSHTNTSTSIRSNIKRDDESWANVDYFHKNKDGADGSHHELHAREDADMAHHQMMAVLEEGSLRVAFRLQEDDV